MTVRFVADYVIHIFPHVQQRRRPDSDGDEWFSPGQTTTTAIRGASRY